MQQHDNMFERRCSTSYAFGLDEAMLPTSAIRGSLRQLDDIALPYFCFCSPVQVMEGRTCKIVAIMVGELSSQLEQQYGRYNGMNHSSDRFILALLVFLSFSRIVSQSGVSCVDLTRL